MVDLALLQSVSYIAGALGVCVAAIYYVINLRVQQENAKHIQKTREMDACRFLTDRMTSDPVMQVYCTMMQPNTKWKDHDDFMEKYGYDNPEMFGHWTSWFFTGETLGYMIKNKIVRAETVYDLGAWGLIRMWDKYSSFIFSRRNIQGQDFMVNFEYVAKEMLKIKQQRDASFKENVDNLYLKTGKN